ncbi:MAG: hypothetical protein JNL06_12305 [Alphaproteobacteria bacterium]|nr:hypothetical protein [Alphaproteobacteria bacterium]
MVFTGIRANFGHVSTWDGTCQRRTAAPEGSTGGGRATIVAVHSNSPHLRDGMTGALVIVIAQFQESLTAMIKGLRVSALAVMGAFLLAGAAYASDTPPAPPAPSSPPPQGEASPPPPGAPPAPPTSQTAEKDPLDEIVCRKEEATVGSRLGSRKVCKTRRQWRDEKRDATSTDLPDGSLQPGPGVNP